MSFDLAAGMKSIETRQKIFIFFLSFLLAIFVEGFDVFGLSSQKDMQNAWLNSAADSIKDSFTHTKTTSQSHEAEPVTVYLLDELTQDTHGFDTTFMPYVYVGNYIDSIASFQPKAIFLDFIYSRHSDKEGILLLCKALEAAKAENKDLSFYSGPISDHPNFSCMKANGLITEVSIRWDIGKPLQYPLYGDAGKSNNGAQKIKTAAHQIYHDIYSQKQELKTDRPIFISYRPYKSKLTTPDHKCEQEAEKNSFSHLLASSVLKRAADSLYTPLSCSDVPQFSLSELDTLGLMSDEEKISYGDRIKDKVVMIGDGLGNDLHPAPIFVQLDGVFQHALALKELKLNRKDYTRWPEEISILTAKRSDHVFFSLSADFLIEWAMALIIILVVQYVLHLKRSFGVAAPLTSVISSRQTVSPLNWLLAIVALVATTVVLSGIIIIFIQMRWLHWPTINMVHILALTAGLLALMELDKLLVKKWSHMILALGVLVVLASLLSLMLFRVLIST